MAPGVETWSVLQILPTLLLQLHGGSDLLELPGDVDDTDHGDDEEDEGLEDNIKWKHGVTLHHPSSPPPLCSRVGRMQ